MTRELLLQLDEEVAKAADAVDDIYRFGETSTGAMTPSDIHATLLKCKALTESLLCAWMEKEIEQS